MNTRYINRIVDDLAALLVIFGGIVLGFKGLFGVNLLSAAFSHLPLVGRLIFVLIGMAAVYEALLWKAVSYPSQCRLSDD